MPDIPYEAYGAYVLCPWRCAVDRIAGETGVCRAGIAPLVADHSPHFGEEPWLSGEGGGGVVRFSCPVLPCPRPGETLPGCGGKALGPETLADIYLALQAADCETLNLTDAVQFLPDVLQALRLARIRGLTLPVVYTTSGYERVATLEALEGIVDIYVADFRYWTSETAHALCGAPTYPAATRRALVEMRRQVGDLVASDEGRALRGLAVRHEVLPGHLDETRGIIEWIGSALSIHTWLELSGGFRPRGEAAADPRLNRTLLPREFEEALKFSGLEGLMRVQPREVPGARKPLDP